MKSRQNAPFIYEICVEGDLGEMWVSWFDGLSIQKEVHPDGNLTITKLLGPIADQPALYGVLNKIQELNLTLVSVIRKM